MGCAGMRAGCLICLTCSAVLLTSCGKDTGPIASQTAPVLQQKPAPPQPPGKKRLIPVDFNAEQGPDKVPAVAAPAKPASVARLGDKIGNLAWNDAEGKPTALHGLQGRKAIVVVFLSFDCPIARSYVAVLSEMARAYADKGVAFIGVCPGADDPAEIAARAKEYKAGFPIFKDDGKAVAEFKAEVTPEAFVVDGKEFVLRYRGRIDSSYSGRLKRNVQTVHHDLAAALDEVLAGKEVSQPATLAIGCAIQTEPPTPAKSGKVTFQRDVAPILNNHCQACHRPGQVGPFPLLTYADAVRWGPDIKQFTQEKRMPSWKPTAGGPFRDERKLSDKDIATLAAWVDEGMPEGDAGSAPAAPVRTFPAATWTLGKPDLILEPKGPFKLGPTGSDIHRYFVLPTNFKESRWIAAVDFQPGNPRVVQHALVMIDELNRARRLEQMDQGMKREFDTGPGYSVDMGVGFFPQGAVVGWSPGQPPGRLPAGTGFLLPPGRDIILQVNYHRTGQVEMDQSKVGIYFAKKPVASEYSGLTVSTTFRPIPAGQPNWRIRNVLFAHRDYEIYSIMPHLHMLGKDIKVTMTPPGGKPRVLIAVKDWEYTWQETYFFDKPIRAPAGTRFEIEAHYDNSTGNPNNPFQPPRDITLGQQTGNEMCTAFLGVTTAKTSDPKLASIHTLLPYPPNLKKKTPQ